MSRLLFTFLIFGIVVFSQGHPIYDYGPFSHEFHHHDFGHSGSGEHDFGHHHFDHHDSGHHGSHHHGNDNSSSIITISGVNKTHAHAGSTLRKFCKQNAAVSAKILYGEDAYIIKYQLQKIDNLNITVRSVNNLIITEVNGKDFQGFQDVRILPEMLNLANGSWWIEQSNLKIVLPYKVDITAEFTAACGEDYGEVNIPGNLVPNFDLKSGI